jgi:hypothetical protein
MATAGEGPELIKKPKCTSVIWQYFGLLKDKPDTDNPVCRTCFKSVSSKGGNTSNLFAHIRDKHPALYPEVLKLREQQTPAAYRPRSTETIRQSMDKANPYAFDSNQAHKRNQAIGYYLSKDMQPLYTVEKPGFKHMISQFDSRYKIPSRRHFADKVVPDLYNEVVTSVTARLKQANYFALTTDMWTSSVMESYMSLTIHFVNDDWLLENIALGAFPMMEDHTADNISSALLALLDDWDLDPQRLVAATTDSASNNVKAFKDMAIPRLSCFGHNLDLAITKGISYAAAQRAVRVCRKAVEAFARSWKRRRDLTAKQVELGIPQHKLIHVSTY